MTTPKRTRVFGYVRISPRPEPGLSVENQIEKIRAQCIVADLELVDVFVDRLKSAKDLDRPALQQALMGMRVGEADGLLIVKLDRLTRSVRDIGSLLEDYFSEKHSLHCIEFAVDTRSASGRMVLNVMITMAQWERETIVERTKDALAYRKKLGVKLGTIAYGSRRVRTTEGERCEVQVDAGEAMALARIAELSASGLGVRAIADKLNADGVATRQGGKRTAAKWHATQVQRVLSRARGSRAVNP